MYVELHARSAFSFLEGSSLPEEMARMCAGFQMPAWALLDVDGVYGAPRFHMAAKKLGIKAHIGAEVSASSPLSHLGPTRRESQNQKVFQNLTIECIFLFESSVVISVFLFSCLLGPDIKICAALSPK